MNKFEIIGASRMPISRRDVRAIIGLIFTELADSSTIRNRRRLQENLVVVFLNPAEMKKINFKFRKKNKDTDVLSFSANDNLGEILISSAKLKKQARQHGLTQKQELAYLLLHGVLHLLGYDHEVSEREEKAMFALQDRVFARILRAL